ncbi:hypothetical protein Tco_0612827, partial [Tanacetum coccineum]
MFVKSSTDNSEVSITSSNKPKLSEVEDSTLSNHDTCKHPLPPLEKLTGVKPVSGPKTIKSILKSKSTFKDVTLKGITINEPSSALARGNKSSSVSKTNSDPADPDLQGQQNLFLPAYIVDIMITNPMIVYTIPYVKYVEAMIMGRDKGGPRGNVVIKKYQSVPPRAKRSGSAPGYDHDRHGHNVIISLRRGIKPRNPQHVTKNYETCGSNVHTTFDHNDIEWFRKREALQAKKVEPFKASKTESSSALRSKTPTK